LYGSSKLSSPKYSNPFCPQIDSSEIGVAAVFFQRADRPEDSWQLSETLKRYAAIKMRCLVVIWAKVKPGPFEVFTANSSLTWLHNTKDKKSKLTRWALQFGNFIFNDLIKAQLFYNLTHLPVNEDLLDENLLGVLAPSCYKTNSISDGLFSLLDNKEENIEIPFSEETLKGWQSGSHYVSSIMDSINTDCSVNNTRRKIPEWN